MPETSVDLHGCHRDCHSVRISSKPVDSLTLTLYRIPVVLIACLLFYLHRRHIRKLREEDTNDPHKSLDFGLDAPSSGGKKDRKVPEMTLTDAEKSMRHNRNVSLEMDVASPYMLPAGLNGSRASLHSLSRTITDSHDPYRPVTFIKGDDYGSRSGSPMRNRGDNGSMYTMSSGAPSDGMNNGLLRNAQRMSTSNPIPARGESLSPQDRTMPEIKFPEPATQPRSPSPLNPSGPPPAGPLPEIKKPLSPEPKEAKTEYNAFKPNAPAPINVQTANAPPPALPRIKSQQALVTETNTASMISESSYGEGFKVTPPSPARHSRVFSDPTVMAPQPVRRESKAPVGLGVDEFGHDANRLSMSLRPLPHDDPNEDPEQRANRIRSFYKEYFDDTKPEPAGGHVYNDYQEDYGSEYLDGAVFDPHSGAFIVAQPQAPFAQPVTRRAMTPPPRAPPRFRSGTNPNSPHMSGSSAGFYPPRGMSSMSGFQPPPRRPLPPPTPLASLPTPAKLKEDSAIFNAMDFAPPVSIRDLQNGMRPDSPLGSPRPYSPSVRPHTPLVSAFEDMPAMPSP